MGTTAANSRQLKTEAMAWLRYGRRCNIVCTEVGRWYSDVLGISSNSVTEIEVKVSRADLNREFGSGTKPLKHITYRENATARSRVPNFFYVFVPKHLGEYAVKLVSEYNPKFGVLATLDEDEQLMLGHNTVCLKKAQKLHTEKPSPALVRSALMRMASELVNRAAALDALLGGVFERIDSRIEKSLSAAQVADDADPDVELGTTALTAVA